MKVAKVPDFQSLERESHRNGHFCNVKMGPSVTKQGTFVTLGNFRNFRRALLSCSRGHFCN